MKEADLIMTPEKQKVEREQKDAEVEVHVTDFFSGERTRGKALAEPSCPKCLGSDDRAVTRSGHE